METRHKQVNHNYTLQKQVTTRALGRAQTSATGAQFLDFQNLSLALILIFFRLYFIFLPIVIRITPNLFFIDPDSDPDYSQNRITCSLSHLGHILKISSKSVHNFLSVFKNYISWIQKFHIVIRITPKIESFLPFTFSDIL